jgi:hypothetical protein
VSGAEEPDRDQPSACARGRASAHCAPTHRTRQAQAAAARLAPVTGAAREASACAASPKRDPSWPPLSSSSSRFHSPAAAPSSRRQRTRRARLGARVRRGLVRLDEAVERRLGGGRLRRGLAPARPGARGLGLCRCGLFGRIPGRLSSSGACAAAAEPVVRLCAPARRGAPASTLRVDRAWPRPTVLVELPVALLGVRPLPVLPMPGAATLLAAPEPRREPERKRRSPSGPA